MTYSERTRGFVDGVWKGEVEKSRTGVEKSRT